MKTEFNILSSKLGFEQTNSLINKSIKTYNEIRPIVSFDYLNPNQAHFQSAKRKKKGRIKKRKRLESLLLFFELIHFL